MVLPPAEPGGPERRFAVDPKKVLGLLLLSFVLGVATMGLIFLPLLRAGRQARADLDELNSEVQLMREQLAQLQTDAMSGPAAPAASGQRDDSGGDRASMPPASLRVPIFDAPPVVRVALKRSKEAVRMKGEGLYIQRGALKDVPMPKGLLVAKAAQGGIFVEGFGVVPDGTRISSRLGPIRIEGKPYPGTLELQREDGKLLLVNEVGLERYLQGVVRSELPVSWGLETKKAQAVAARTYALIRKASTKGPFDLEASVDDQVYKGDAIDPTTRAAVAATSGEVLTKDGYLVTAYFHSTCGDHTELPGAVWGADPDQPSHGNTAVACGFCERSQTHRWTVDLTPEEILKAVRQRGFPEVEQVTGLRIRSRSDAGRVSEIDVLTDGPTVSWSGNDFRRALGWGKVKSTWFDLETVDDAVFRLSGKGSGHGVGMCQWGIHGMEQEGKDYREMLGHYYPRTRVEMIY